MCAVHVIKAHGCTGEAPVGVNSLISRCLSRKLNGENEIHPFTGRFGAFPSQILLLSGRGS